jgi:energy-coupling factor transport system substrate-specific component
VVHVQIAEVNSMNLNRIVLVAACIAINVGLAKVATLLQLPVYLDTPGTILAAALLPPAWAIGVAVSTSVVGALTINGVWIYYVGTQIVIAVVILLAARCGFLRKWWTSIIAGVAVGICAAVVSAPVTVIVFGGVTVLGPTAINAVLLASGRTLWQSVLTGSLLIELLDKPTAALLSWMVILRLPRHLFGKTID